MGGGSWAEIEANGGGRGVLPAPGAVIEAKKGGGGSCAEIKANGGGRGVLPAPGAVIEANEGGRRVLGQNRGKRRWERGPSCAWGCNRGERRWEEGPGPKLRQMEVGEGSFLRLGL